MQIAPYKAKFIELMVKSGVLLFGEFTTKSGRLSPYFINTGLYRTGGQAEQLSGYYAQLIHETLGGGVDALFGPAYKGIPLCVLASAALWRNFDVDVGYCFNRKEAKDHGEGGVIVGWQPKDGDHIAIIEDVISAGTAVREVMPLLRATADVRVEHMFISANRMEKGYEGRTAVQEIYDGYGITVHSIVNVTEILSYLYGREIDGRIVIDDAMKSKMEDYIGQYCVL